MNTCLHQVAKTSYALAQLHCLCRIIKTCHVVSTFLLEPKIQWLGFSKRTILPPNDTITGSLADQTRFNCARLNLPYDQGKSTRALFQQYPNPTAIGSSTHQTPWAHDGYPEPLQCHATPPREMLLRRVESQGRVMGRQAPSNLRVLKVSSRCKTDD